MNNRFVRPPRRLQRRGVRLDNVPLVPENLLPHKAQWQQPANEPPCGDVLIVLQLGIVRSESSWNGWLSRSLPRGTRSRLCPSRAFLNLRKSSSHCCALLRPPQLGRI
jgi:hypothetical protein